MSDKKISIYIATHVKFDPPKDPIYIPISAGAALRPEIPYKGDNTGFNISLRNKNYCELSVQYWAWRNDHTSDIKGLVHYHRFFVAGEGSNRHALNREEIEEKLSKYDVILNGDCSDDDVQGYNDDCSNSVYSSYADVHHQRDMDLVLEYVQNHYPKEFPSFCKEMMRTHRWAINCVLITRAEIFDQYCSWLFPIYAWMDQRININEYDDYNRRIYGFLGERILRPWVRSHGYTCVGCEMGDLNNDQYQM